MKENKKAVGGKRHSAAFLVGAAIGSVLVYFFDPYRGNYRRAKFKDKSLKFKKSSVSLAERQLKNVRNQFRGFTYGLKNLFIDQGPVENSVLEARIRSKIGRKISHAHAVKVNVIDGNVTLSGPILRREVNQVLACARTVSGVKKLVNKLEPHERAGNIPELQGEGPLYLQQV